MRHLSALKQLQGLHNPARNLRDNRLLDFGDFMPRPAVSASATFTAEEATILNAICILYDSKTIKTDPKGPAMLAKIDLFHDKGRISFDPSMSASTYGESAEAFFNSYLRLNTGWVGHQATAALVMAHEAVHLVTRAPNELDEELECRQFDCAMLREIMTGISYTDPLGATATAKVTAGPLFSAYNAQLKWAAADQLVDQTISLPIYARHLDADWVVKHLSDWGGLKNRWATTLGNYVRVLADPPGRPSPYAAAFVEVLEAIPKSHWAMAVPVMGPMTRVQAMGTFFSKLPGPYAARLAAAGAKLGVPLTL